MLHRQPVQHVAVKLPAGHELIHHRDEAAVVKWAITRFRTSRSGLPMEFIYSTSQ
jgi:hypothetical protein